ncbi:hypothetical protein AKJ16_DCAP05719 [Drosera capensis]
MSLIKQEMMQFGKISLPTQYQKPFRVNSKISLNEQQQCLLDALWNSQGKKKLDALNALSFYFSTLTQTSWNLLQLWNPDENSR